MDNDFDRPLDETESLRQSPEPPAMLETRVVQALQGEGLIRTPLGSSWLSRIAASLLVFALGAAAGHYLLPDLRTPQAAPAQPRYLLLLAGEVTPAPDGSTHAAEYGNWARSVGAQGVSISGEELAGHAETVSNVKGATFPDLTTVGGYFLIEAKDDAAAAALAKTCPHIRYGGSIVIRKVVK